MIAETKIWELGVYTVREQPRPDNPFWPVYIVMLKASIIGRMFSRPALSDCEWLKHQGGAYAAPQESAGPPRNFVVNRHGRPRRTLTQRRKA